MPVAVPRDEVPEVTLQGEPEMVPERFRGASARTLERVAPVVQGSSSGGMPVALASTELHGDRDCVSRFSISSSAEHLGMPESEVLVRDIPGRSCAVLPYSAGSSGSDAEVSLYALGLPEPTEPEVEFSRVVERDRRHEVEVAS